MSRLPDPRQLRLFLVSALQNSMRSGTGILFLVFTVITALLTVSMVLKPLDVIIAKAKDNGVQIDKRAAMQELLTFTTPMVSWLLSNHPPAQDGQTPTAQELASQQQADRWTHYLQDEKPAPLSACYLLLCFCLPFLISLAACDQVSSDIQARRLRFLLSRANRATIFFGRALGITVYVASALALAMAVTSLFIGSQLGFYSGWAIFSWTLRCWLMLVVAALPSIAVCSMISASFGSAFGSLAISNIIFAAVPLLPAVVRVSSGMDVAQGVKWLLPLPFQAHLFHYSVGHVGLAIVGCLAYAAAYFALGFWIFLRRDL